MGEITRLQRYLKGEIALRFYISGQITDNPSYKDDFERAEDYLQKEYPEAEIINPVLVNSFLPKSTEYEDYMRMSMVMLDMCSHIYFIKGWQDSKGANWEMGYALASGKNMLFE